LDKKQGSYQQVMSPNAVKQDLVISAYKPNGGLEQRFRERGASEASAWDFVQTHLKYLPVAKTKHGELEIGWWPGSCATMRRCPCRRTSS